jgi:hypothetical protein
VSLLVPSVNVMYIQVGEPRTPSFGVACIRAVREKVLTKKRCAQSMCCGHLGKCAHCTVLHILGIMHGNECLCFEAREPM